MPLRVLHIDSGKEWRGGQRQVYLLAQGQRERGLEPLVVSIPGSPLLQRLRTRGLAASAIKMRANWDLPAARRLRKLARHWRADIVHAHDARAHALALTSLIRRETPLIVTRRVPFVPKSVRVKYGRRVARFIAISRAVRAAMIDGGIAEERIDLVYSGVPSPVIGTPRNWRTECRWPSEAVLCGVVGAMTGEKGMEALTEIGSHLAAESRARVRLLLLGGQAAGPCEIGGLEAFRAGFVDEIHAAMAGLDVLWHPSSAEGLGTAVIDSMALGVPPVAFAVGGLPELVEHERSGLLAPPGDTRAFAVQAARLLEDPALRLRLAAAGPIRAREFGVERMVEGVMDTYRKVLGGA
jgi:L-malate glycosyltransferase